MKPPPGSLARAPMPTLFLVPNEYGYDFSFVGEGKFKSRVIPQTQVLAKPNDGFVRGTLLRIGSHDVRRWERPPSTLNTWPVMDAAEEE